MSATSITATTPARGAGAADIVVTNPDGQGGRLAGGFTYDTPVVPAAVDRRGHADVRARGRRDGREDYGRGFRFRSHGVVWHGGGERGERQGSGSLTATAPARSAGSVDVVVANPDGQSARMNGVFTYVGSAPPPPPPSAPVAPTVTAVSTCRQRTTAGGTAVTVTGLGFAAGRDGVL